MRDAPPVCTSAEDSVRLMRALPPPACVPAGRPRGPGVRQRRPSRLPRERRADRGGPVRTDGRVAPRYDGGAVGPPEDGLDSHPRGGGGHRRGAKKHCSHAGCLRWRSRTAGPIPRKCSLSSMQTPLITPPVPSLPSAVHGGSHIFRQDCCNDPVS